MSESKLNSLISEHWRALGFFYVLDDSNHEWRLTGSRYGLQNFARILTNYTNNPGNDLPSEHDHLGPYMYLKIMTWPQAGISKNSIHGTLPDLQRLATIVDDAVSDMHVGETVRIQMQYTSDAEYAIVLQALDDDTDPSLLDPDLNKTNG